MLWYLQVFLCEALIFASVLSERIGLKDYIGNMCLYSMTHAIFLGGSVLPGSHRPIVCCIDSECKTKN